MILRFRSFNHRPDIYSIKTGTCCCWKYVLTFSHDIIKGAIDDCNNIKRPRCTYYLYWLFLCICQSTNIVGSCDVIPAERKILLGKTFQVLHLLRNNIYRTHCSSLFNRLTFLSIPLFYFTFLLSENHCFAWASIFLT